MKKIIFLAVAALAACFGASAGSKTYYSKVTATAETGKGLVYVSKTEATPVDADFTQSSASVDLEGSSQSQQAYIYAKPLTDGEVFKYWLDGTGKSIAGPKVTVTGNEKKGTEYVFTPVFGAPSAVTVSVNDPALGSVTIDKFDNAVGDQITVTAAKIRVRNSEMGAHYSKAHVFEGWYDSNGNLVSKDLKYTFKITEPTNLTARFSLDKFITGEGYYRVRWFGHDGEGKEEFMTLIGAYNPVTSSSDRHLAGVLQFTTSKSNPANVMLVNGAFKDVDNHTGEVEVMSDVELSAQGMSTGTILSDYTLNIATAHNPGYYKIKCSGLTIAAWSHGASMSENGATLFITRNKPDDDINDPNSYFDFEPLDAAHIDEFYFGAEPVAEMEFDGGYWTSMYTSFPYECWSEDGVEAYYISEIIPDGTTSYAVLKQIEDGVVPAYSAVLLKCKGLAAKQNRLLPLMDCEKGALEGNMLKGEFQLNKSATDSGKVTFNSENMRVFSSNSAGAVGFYRLEDGTELAANRAWLDVSGASSAPARIMLVSDAAGVENVVVDGGDTFNGDGTVYDLYGRRVAHPSAGNIYIVNGRKIVYK